MTNDKGREWVLWEAAKEKVLLLKAGPLRPNPPLPLELNGFYLMSPSGGRRRRSGKRRLSASPGPASTTGSRPFSSAGKIRSFLNFNAWSDFVFLGLLSVKTRGKNPA